MNKQTKALKELLEAVEHAIEIGDWKVDGRCDPDLAINRAKEALEQEEVSDAELISYRQGYEQGRFDYEMDLELGKIKQLCKEKNT